MRFSAALVIYRLLLPLLFLAAFPGWILKMLKRGGLGTRLGERAAIYTTAPEFEPCGAVHIHAISVGESLLALKLIRHWLSIHPTQRFVLATGTAPPLPFPACASPIHRSISHPWCTATSSASNPRKSF